MYKVTIRFVDGTEIEINNVEEQIQLEDNYFCVTENNGDKQIIHTFFDRQVKHIVEEELDENNE